MQAPRRIPETDTVQENADTNFSMPSENKESQPYAMGDLTVKPHRVLPHMGGRRIYQPGTVENEAASTDQSQAQAQSPEDKKQPSSDSNSATQSQPAGTEKHNRL